MRNRQLYILASLLAVAGLSIFLFKYQTLGFPVRADAETQVWNVEAAVNFEPGPASVKVTLQIPSLTPGYTLLDESFVSRGFGLSTHNTTNGREAQWAVREADGPQTVYYRALVYRDPAKATEDSTPPFPEIPEFDEPSRIAVDGLIAEVRRQSADVASFTSELLRHINNAGSDQYVRLFLSDTSSPNAKAQLATRVLAAAQIPARVSHGVYLREGTAAARTVPLLEVHDGVEWLYFDPVTRAQGWPQDFLVWWRGNGPIADVDGGVDVDVSLAVQRSVLNSLEVAERRMDSMGSQAFGFSLFSLPITTQAVYSVLVMIPIGALVIVLLRNFVGIKTFGTFMPVLVALAFRETRLLWGIVLFAVIVALGLLIRFYLERLRLLLVPRLTCVLTVVVILMAGISVLSQRLDLQPGLSIALFPMVIISMTIERMSIVWEERGASEALQEGFGSLVVAALTYVVMGIPWLSHLIFVFPELLLVVLAVTLLTGRYTGYRLLELKRFRSFAKPANPAGSPP